MTLSDRLQRGGVEIDYAVHGPDAGPPLLLVMGLGMQRTAWPQSLLDALVQQGFRCISFDNRDIGLSTRYDAHGVPPLHRVIAARLLRRAYRTPYTLPDIADDGAAVLDHLGIAQAHVLGISMGGMIAQHIAARHAARVRSLTLMSTSSGRLGLPLPSASVLKLMLSRPSSRISLDAAIDYWVRLFELIGSPAYPMPRDEMVRRAEASLRRAPTGTGVARQLAAILGDGDRTPLLRRLDAPTLILHGTDDAMVPLAHGHDLARVIPGARLHTLRGWGHDLPEALSAEFAALIAEHARVRAVSLG
ncbi:MAG: alpha/beta fold hydrolase [Xanthomonadales bacterium]|nr:alpha/beta fold hydrolase [Xanthomonadales bacterium]